MMRVRFAAHLSLSSPAPRVIDSRPKHRAATVASAPPPYRTLLISSPVSVSFLRSHASCYMHSFDAFQLATSIVEDTAIKEGISVGHDLRGL